MKMTYSSCRFIAVAAVVGAFVLVGARSASAQSTYLTSTDQADYSGMGGGGGTIIVPYTLLFGEAPPGMGSTFDIALTVSDITSYVSGNSYSWAVLPADPALGLVGLAYPTNVFDDLPASNLNALPLTAGGVTLEVGVNDRLWMEANLNEGNVQFLGEFTVTLGEVPGLPPDYYASLELNIFGERHFFLMDGGEVIAGIWATPLPPLIEENTDIATRLGPFGTSVTYQFTAFSTGPLLPITGEVPMWAFDGAVQFAPIPEPGGFILGAVAGGGWLLFCWLRRRSGSSLGGSYSLSQLPMSSSVPGLVSGPGE